MTDHIVKVKDFHRRTDQHLFAVIQALMRQRADAGIHMARIDDPDIRVSCAERLDGRVDLPQPLALIFAPVRGQQMMR